MHCVGLKFSVVLRFFSVALCGHIILYELIYKKSLPDYPPSRIAFHHLQNLLNRSKHDITFKAMF